jgi:hypothetical protein
MLSYLIYTSKNNGVSDDEIKDILDKARENNKSVNVTGMLVSSEEHFVQYLEGDRKDVSLIYNKIILDDRHDSIELMKCDDVKKTRLFQKWSMAMLEDNEKTKEILNEYEIGVKSFYELSANEILDVFIKISVFYTLSCKTK